MLTPEEYISILSLREINTIKNNKIREIKISEQVKSTFCRRMKSRISSRGHGITERIEEFPPLRTDRKPEYRLPVPSGKHLRTGTNLLF